MAQQTAAVIGAGTCGLSTLKTLREDGFRVTGFERRERVGGLWAYTDDPSMTSALKTTRALISKHTCGMTDFSMPDKYPSHLSTDQFQEYIESYAKHFDLLQDITFNATVTRTVRNEDDTRRRLEILISGEERIEEFDKYRNACGLEDKNIVVVGMSSTASDIINSLLTVTPKVYMSHRRGGYIFPTWRKGVPGDLNVTWRRRQIVAFFQRHLPGLYQWCTDKGLAWFMSNHWGKLDPAWRITPAPSIALSLPGASNSIVPLLKEGKIVSMHGIRRFLSSRSVEFNDGTVLDDVEAVICATGYSADLEVAPFPEKSRPPDYQGPELVRLWMNIFPPQYVDSMALLCHSAYGKNNGFSFNDVQSMAISNIFRGVHPLPSRDSMNAWINAHHSWLASRFRAEPLGFNASAVKTWEFQQFLHDAAGTGMENLGYRWKGWKFFIHDPKMSLLMNNGVETAHAFRYFETGKRRTWEGAREAIIKANEAVKVYPLKEDEKQL